jgi:iron complex transport system ATP-binding protein
VIELKNISIGYGNDPALLRGLSLTAGKGELVALAGRNGSGKSTLLRSILGLLPLLEGSCLLEGKAVETLEARIRARMISYVSSGLKDPGSIRVEELVSLGRIPYTGWMGKLSSVDRMLVDRTLQETGLASLRSRPMDQLSDGERQRAMIARAVVQDTPVMILDEPASYLDIASKFELLGMLSAYRDRGKTIVYSTHDLESALGTADKFWVIEEGKVHQGAPEDLGISGIFDRLFASSGVRYDRVKGKFRLDPSPRGSLQLTGDEGLVRTWTQHALERIGYSTGKDPVEGILHIEGGPGNPLWTVNRSGKQTRFTSLYNLARFLTQVG